MPDDVGGTPSPDGGDHDSHDHGGADDAFAAVVFDEAFVRSATVHEPSAAERLRAAERARAEAERSGGGIPAGGGGSGPPYGEYGCEYGREWDDLDEEADLLDGRSVARRRSGPGRWHRTVAWILALVMGIGVIALTVLAVYRGASATRQQPAPAPTGTSRVDPTPSEPPVVPPMAEHAPPVP